jgi:hypothetical protein
MGQQRQESYLKVFKALKPEAEKALLDIYNQAHKGGKEMGRHVVMAMVASVRYPELFRFTLSNIVVRLLLKRFQLEGDWRKMLQMKDVLDDFHVALDEFAKEASAREDMPQLALLNGGRADVQELRQFKGLSAASVNRAKYSWRQ